MDLFAYSIRSAYVPGCNLQLRPTIICLLKTINKVVQSSNKTNDGVIDERCSYVATFWQ